ncbi:MAG: hypothetical protein AAF654_02140 [Myxococcota bacterium]
MFALFAFLYFTADEPLEVSLSDRVPGEQQSATVLRKALARELALAGLKVVKARSEGGKLTIRVLRTGEVTLEDRGGNAVGAFPAPASPADAVGLALQIAERVYGYLGISSRPNTPVPKAADPPPSLEVVPVPPPPVWGNEQPWSAAVLAGAAVQTNGDATAFVLGELIHDVGSGVGIGIRGSGTPLIQRVGSEETARVRRGTLEFVGRLRLRDGALDWDGFITAGAAYLRGRGEVAANGLLAPASDSTWSATFGGGVSADLPLNGNAAIRFELGARYSVPSPYAFAATNPERLDAPILTTGVGLHFH